MHSIEVGFTEPHSVLWPVFLLSECCATIKIRQNIPIMFAVSSPTSFSLSY